MIKDYYKIIDKSIFDSYMTVPKDYVESFSYEEPIEPGTGRKLEICFKGTKYPAVLRNANSQKSTYYQLDWSGTNELKNELSKEFVQSFLAIQSQSRQSGMKHFKTNLEGGNQEVIILKPINKYLIEIETFIQVKTPFDPMFKRLIDSGVFAWLKKKTDTRNFFIQSTGWIDQDELFKHINRRFVIYYLVDDANKQIYIGSAMTLGDRVKPNRIEIPMWNKFRYEVVSPEYHELLRAIEYHSIAAFANFFNSPYSKGLGFSEYKLVNKDYNPNRYTVTKKTK